MNVFSTLVAIFMVDKWGRKVLFLEGGIQMLASEVVVAIVLGILFSTVPAKLSAGVRAAFSRMCLAVGLSLGEVPFPRACIDHRDEFLQHGKGTLLRACSLHLQPWACSWCWM